MGVNGGSAQVTGKARRGGRPLRPGSGRQAATQRRTSEAAPQKPRWRISRQSCNALWQPAAQRSRRYGSNGVRIDGRLRGCARSGKLPARRKRPVGDREKYRETITKSAEGETGSL